MDTLHPSHVTRISMDASSYDEICVNCGATDLAIGGWGALAKPCPKPVGKGGITLESYWAGRKQATLMRENPNIVVSIVPNAPAEETAEFDAQLDAEINSRRSAAPHETQNPVDEWLR